MNNKKEIAIQLSGVKKMYKLGQIGGGSLQGDLQSWWARIRGKEDPNVIIGQEQRLVGQTFMALNGIDLTVYKGEALGIIGANGAGKSTMLKLLSRVTAPTNGTINIYGRIASMLEVGTGFNGEMTGRENIYMNGAILGMTKSEIDAKMEDIIDFSEVRDFIDTPVKRYSSGMYVKLAFSVAVHLDSEIMIMDEVLAVGDMAFQRKCLTKMSEAANKEGRTVLYVSHNMNTIRQLCDRCIVMDKGKIVFDGNVEEAIDAYSNTQKTETVNIDLENKKREFYIQHKCISALYSTFINKKDNVFDSNETIDIRITWKNLEDIENLSLRIEVWGLDNTRVGSYMIYDFYHGKKDNTGELTFSLNLESLQNAEYKLFYAFFIKDEYGNNLDADLVSGQSFRIEKKYTNNYLDWRTKSWGYIEFPSPDVISVK